MKIDRLEARRIAALAHLEFDDSGLDRMAAEMTAILGYIDQLSEAEVEASGSQPAPFDNTTAPAESRRSTQKLHRPLRGDEVRPGVTREEVERNAPAWRDGHFVVPKVIGE